MGGSREKSYKYIVKKYFISITVVFALFRSSLPTAWKWREGEGTVGLIWTQSKKVLIFLVLLLSSSFFFLEETCRFLYLKGL